MLVSFPDLILTIAISVRVSLLPAKFICRCNQVLWRVEVDPANWL
jgi:hypothetical protein